MQPGFLVIDFLGSVFGVRARLSPANQQLSRHCCATEYRLSRCFFRDATIECGGASVSKTWSNELRRPTREVGDELHPCLA
jgi:hypothetical protein